MHSRAEWMTKGSYGLMVHYTVTPKGTTQEEKTADLNRTVDSFDIDYFMKQFEASKADWLIFTIGQCTGYYSSPNTYLDKVLPGHTSRRDLALEVAKRVKAMNKRFIIYMTSELFWNDAAFHEAFAWKPGDQSEYLNRYLQFVSAYSSKFGTLADGWWIDGCYDHITEGKWDWARWIAALRAGNPNAATAFNDGSFCVGRLKPVTPLQDYHAGEVHLLEDGKIRTDYLQPEKVEMTADGKLRMPGIEPQFHMPTEQYIHGVQWHALVPVDIPFNGAVPLKYCDYSVETLAKFVLDCRKVKGAVTINLPVGPDGHIPEKSAAKAVELGKALTR